jgi:hypothetical protein
MSRLFQWHRSASAHGTSHSRSQAKSVVVLAGYVFEIDIEKRIFVSYETIQLSQQQPLP